MLMVLVGVVLGGIFAFVIQKFLFDKSYQNALFNKDEILKSAKIKAENLIKDAKNESEKVLNDSRREIQSQKDSLISKQKDLINKEKSFEKQLSDLDSKKESLEKEKSVIQAQKKEAETALQAQEKKIEEIAKMSKEDALDLLMKNVEKENKQEILDYVKNLEKELTEDAEQKARMILTTAMQKIASEVASENTSTVVNLPSDDMKGRIIGKEGRNIQTFERLTGVDVVVDDTPGVVLISAFDLLRRYVAKVSLERLLADGRINPARIEEVVKKVMEEVDTLVFDLGQKACFEANVAGLSDDLLSLLGKLKFRTIQSQNLLKFALDVGALSMVIASSLGYKSMNLKKIALLKFVGQSVDHEVTGQMEDISADICKKFGVSSEVVESIKQQKESVKNESMDALIVKIATKLALSRPNMNKNNMESFVKRMSELETVAKGFEGVKDVFALHTGQEVRVIVDADKLDDLETKKLSSQIANRIHQDLAYQGQIKVNVIREKRVEDFAV
tara:strand:+ start:72 stop:1583 length:1512 start_codon:yes stop_codon:yes gene_type:complete